VPQTAYFGVRQGDHATVTVPEIEPDLDRTVRAMRGRSPLARALFTEVDVDNKAGELAAVLFCYPSATPGLKTGRRVRRSRDFR